MLGGTSAGGRTTGTGGVELVTGGTITGGTTANSGGSSGGTMNNAGGRGSAGIDGSSGGMVIGSGGTMGRGGATGNGGTAAGGSAGASSGFGGSGGSSNGGAGGGKDAAVDGPGGARDAGSTPSGGAGGSTSGTCGAPPAPSALVGWATASGSTTGGGNATPTTVTTLAALVSAVKGTTPAVIYVKGVLAAGGVAIGSNKTIVGLCGAEIHGHIAINKSSNVILRNIKIVGYAVGNCNLDPSYSSGTGCSSGDDAISIEGQSDHIWLDHDDISDGTDGNLDITHGCDFITISWTKFHYSSARTDPVGSDSTGANGHRYSNLVGHSDSNAAEDTGHLTITWHHNWWADFVVERQPRVRFGRVHLFNNLYTSAGDDYCIGVGAGANLRTENNVFVGVKTPIDTTGYSDATSAVRSTGNLYSGTSGDAPADLKASSVFDPAASYTYTLDDASGLQAAIEAGAGPK
jgi:pectate lyase